MSFLHCGMRAGWSIAYDAPRTVGLTAGGAETLLGLAADGHAVLELATVGAGLVPAIAGRGDGAGGAIAIPSDVAADWC